MNSKSRTTIQSDMTMMTKLEEQVLCDHHIIEEENNVEFSEGNREVLNLVIPIEKDKTGKKLIRRNP
jgi:hypothetical protein